MGKLPAGCEYCELWNQYAGKCTYEHCPIDEDDSEYAKPLTARPGESAEVLNRFFGFSGLEEYLLIGGSLHEIRDVPLSALKTAESR